MPYIKLENFRPGLDTRRSELTSQPGVLATAENVHINPGGEVEKRKAFVPQDFGLYIDEHPLVSVPAIAALSYGTITSNPSGGSFFSSHQGQILKVTSSVGNFYFIICSVLSTSTAICYNTNLTAFSGTLAAQPDNGHRYKACFGLQDTTAGLIVFSYAADPGTLPSPYVWQQLVNPIDATWPMLAVTTSCNYGGKAWVIARFYSFDGTSYGDNAIAYYDGVAIGSWSNGFVITKTAFINSMYDALNGDVDGLSGFHVQNKIAATSFEVYSDYGLSFTVVADVVSSAAGTITATKINGPVKPLTGSGASGSFEITGGTPKTGVLTLTGLVLNNNVVIGGITYTFVNTPAVTGSATAVQVRYNATVATALADLVKAINLTTNGGAYSTDAVVNPYHTAVSVGGVLTLTPKGNSNEAVTYTFSTTILASNGSWAVGAGIQSLSVTKDGTTSQLLPTADAPYWMTESTGDTATNISRFAAKLTSKINSAGSGFTAIFENGTVFIYADDAVGALGNGYVMNLVALGDCCTDKTSFILPEETGNSVASITINGTAGASTLTSAAIPAPTLANGFPNVACNWASQVAANVVARSATTGYTAFMYQSRDEATGLITATIVISALTRTSADHVYTDFIVNTTVGQCLQGGSITAPVYYTPFKGVITADSYTVSGVHAVIQSIPLHLAITGGTGSYFTTWSIDYSQSIAVWPAGGLVPASTTIPTTSYGISNNTGSYDAEVTLTKSTLQDPSANRIGFAFGTLIIKCQVADRNNHQISLVTAYIQIVS